MTKKLRSPFRPFRRLALLIRPGHAKGSFQDVRLSFGQPYQRGALLAPFIGDRKEHFRCVFHHSGLLIGGEQQNAAYGGLGLRPEEYSVMVLIAEYQQKLAKAA